MKEKAEILHIEKLNLEIKKLKRPWYRQTQNITLLIGIISLLIAWYNGFFESQRKEIRIENMLLEIKSKQLDEIEKEILQFNHIKDSLVKENGEYGKLLSDLTSLNKIIDSLYINIGNN